MSDGVIPPKRFANGEIVMVRGDYAIVVIVDGREVWLSNMPTERCGWRIAWQARLRDVRSIPHSKQGGIISFEGDYIN